MRSQMTDNLVDAAVCRITCTFSFVVRSDEIMNALYNRILAIPAIRNKTLTNACLAQNLQRVCNSIYKKFTAFRTGNGSVAERSKALV